MQLHNADPTVMCTHCIVYKRMCAHSYVYIGSIHLRINAIYVSNHTGIYLYHRGTEVLHVFLIQLSHRKIPFPSWATEWITSACTEWCPTVLGSQASTTRSHHCLAKPPGGQGSLSHSHPPAHMEKPCWPSLPWGKGTAALWEEGKEEKGRDGMTEGCSQVQAFPRRMCLTLRQNRGRGSAGAWSSLSFASPHNKAATPSELNIKFIA